MSTSSTHSLHSLPSILGLAWFDLTTIRTVGVQFTGHTHGVTAVTVGELDGRPIVVSGGGGDSTVRVSDLANGGNPRVIRLGFSVRSVTKPKNDLVIIGHGAGLTAVRI